MIVLAQTNPGWDWNEIRAWFTDHVPTILAAAAVLILGWLVALVISWIVQALLRRTRIDDRIVASMAEDDQQAPDVSKTAGRVVFWVLMLFVLVGFFQVLGLDAVTNPLNGFLQQVFAYAPRLLAAGGLILLAWILATVLRLIVRKALEAARIDQRIEEQVETPTAPDPEADEEEQGRRRRSRRSQLGLSRTAGNAVYWLVWLLFIPAILDALALGGLLQPVQSLVNKILSFLPNLLAAAAILVLGWFLARVVQRLAVNLLAALGADQLADRVGIDQILGSTRLSEALGVVIHVLILIPVLIASLNALQLEAVTAPLSQMLNDLLMALPNLLGAFLLISIAYVVGRLVGRTVADMLGRIGFDELPVRLGLTEAVPKKASNKPSNIAGTVVTVGIILFAVMQALRLLHFEGLEALLARFVVFAGNVLLGLVIIAVGLYASNFVAGLIRDSKVRQADFLSWAARVSILALAGAMGLQEMGLGSDIVTLAFGLSFGAVAVAAAIAFGVGGREQARELIEEFVEERRGPANGRRSRRKSDGGG